MLLITLLERGHVVGIVLVVALLVVLGLFGAGYWWFISRGHQDDPPKDGY